MSVSSIFDHPRYTLARIVGVRRHWYTVSAGSIWKRYSESQWEVVPTEKLEAQIREHRLRHRDARLRGDNPTAVRHAECLMDIENALACLVEQVA